MEHGTTVESKRYARGVYLVGGWALVQVGFIVAIAVRHGADAAGFATGKIIAGMLFPVVATVIWYAWSKMIFGSKWRIDRWMFAFGAVLWTFSALAFLSGFAAGVR